MRYGNASWDSVAVPTQSGGRSANACLALVAPAETSARASNASPFADQHAQLVVAQEHHVLGVVEHAGLGEPAADRDEHEPHPGVRPLVDEEVVVGRERVHPQREVERGLEPVAPLAGRDAVHQLVDRPPRDRP